MPLEFTRATFLGESIPYKFEKIFYLHKSKGVSWSLRDQNEKDLYGLIKHKYGSEWNYDHRHWELPDSETRNQFLTQALNLVAPEEYFFVEYEKMYRDVKVIATIIDNDIGYFKHNNPHITASLLNKSWLQTNDIQQEKWWEHSTIVIDKKFSKILKEIENKGADITICSDHQCAPVLLAEHDNAYEFVCSPELEPLHFLLRDRKPIYGGYFDEEIKHGNWQHNEHQRIRPNSRWDGSIWTQKHEVHKTIKICRQYSIPIIYP